MGFQESIITEKNKLTQEAEKYKAETNLPGFWVAEEGENRFTVLQEDIREKDFGNGARKIFAIQVAGVRKDWSVNPENPVYPDLVTKLAEGKRDFVMLRTGTGKQTRYKFLNKA